MKAKRFEISGEVKIFPVENPWPYVDVPDKYTEETKHLADRGLVPITVCLGKSQWNTSIMPMGDGKKFIAINAKVRKAEGIEVGDKVELSFTVRER